MAEAYEGLAAAGASRAQMQRLCSLATFPGFAAEDDATRLADLESWIHDHDHDLRVRALAEPLVQAATPAERAELLRQASKAIEVFTCDVAKAIEIPPPVPDAGEAGP
jgi:hypothetical protein